MTKSSPKCRCGYGFMWKKPSPKEEETRFCLHQTSLNLTNGNRTKAKTDTIDTIACHCREEKPLICIKAPLFSSFFFVWAWTPTHLHLYLDKTLTKSIDVGMDSCEQNPQQKNKNFFLSTPNFSILISQVVDYIKAKTFWYHCL